MEHGPGRERPPTSPTHQANAGRSSGVPRCRKEGRRLKRPQSMEGFAQGEGHQFTGNVRAIAANERCPAALRRREPLAASFSLIGGKKWDAAGAQTLLHSLYLVSASGQSAGDCQKARPPARRAHQPGRRMDPGQHDLG
jgi:hypothetical protein